VLDDPLTFQLPFVILNVAKLTWLELFVPGPDVQLTTVTKASL